MDHCKTLQSLTTISEENFNDESKQILEDSLPLLRNPKEITHSELGEEISNQEYLTVRFIAHLLRELKERNTSTEYLSVKEFRTIKLGIGLMTSRGILPCLLPRLRRSTTTNSMNPQKYEQLCFVIDLLLNFHQDFFLRPAIISVLNPLLLGLLQLSHTPLSKTTEMYEKFKKDQEEYSKKLSQLINDCQETIIMKELMIILGDKIIPKYLRIKIEEYLIRLVLKPNGVASIFTTVCGDTVDIGKDWKKLETISKLLATPQGPNHLQYYDVICSQLIDILKSKTIKYSSTIIKYCILALNESNRTICLEKIIYVIQKPLLIEYDEEQVENCIECLSKCFITQRLPLTFLSNVSVPLFSLYDRLSRTVLALKFKVQDLIILLLNDETLRKQLYSVYLGHETTTNFGPWTTPSQSHQELATTLLNLTSTSQTLTIDLFSYLLEYLTRQEDTDLEKIIIAVTMLTNLSNQQIVQKSQTDNPKPLFNFVKSLFKKDYSTEILYTSLMWINVIVSNNTNQNYDEFLQFLQTQSNNVELPLRIKSLIQKIIDNIKNKDKKRIFSYDDLSVDNQEYDSAMKDLSDTLLPVRAHGLMTLTKLIEKRDSRTMNNKIIVIHIFQEHLKHEDSFVYLTSINGLCALATTCPESLIDILIQEYISMPERIEITSETRMKIGEILVKTIKSLGEMASVYKNILINGFLCAARDEDSLIRASSLSCIGELCRVLGFRLGNIVIEILYCASCIMKTDKSIDCRRAAVLLTTLLLRGLGKDVLTNFDRDLIDLFRALKHVRDTEDDPVIRLHAQLGLEEFDDIVENHLFAKPILEKKITLTGNKCL